MTCYVLYASKDHGSKERPGKHKCGQLICIKEPQAFYGWGRREIPERGYGSIKVDAWKWQLMSWMEPLLNRPRLEWSVHGNHMRVNITMPPWSPLTQNDREWLPSLFPNTFTGASAQGWTVDLYTDRQIRNFSAYFNREFADKLQKKEGPRYVMNPKVVQQIAFDGGFGKCDKKTFDDAMHDRTPEAING